MQSYRRQSIPGLGGAFIPMHEQATIMRDTYWNSLCNFTWNTRRFSLYNYIMFIQMKRSKITETLPRRVIESIWNNESGSASNNKDSFKTYSHAQAFRGALRIGWKATRTDSRHYHLLLESCHGWTVLPGESFWCAWCAPSSFTRRTYRATATVCTGSLKAMSGIEPLQPKKYLNNDEWRVSS